MCKWHLCEYYTFGEQPGFHSLKPLGRTRMLQGLNLQPLAFARLTQTTQPWWHHSPHCHISLIASLLSANLCSSSNLLTTDDSLNVSVQVNISGCLCCTAVVSKDVPHLSVQSLRSSVFVQATSSHQANLTVIVPVVKRRLITTFWMLWCTTDLFWIFVSGVYANSLHSACSVKRKRLLGPHCKDDIFKHFLHVGLLISLPAVSVLVLLLPLTVVFCCVAKVTTGE